MRVLTLLTLLLAATLAFFGGCGGPEGPPFLLLLALLIWTLFWRLNRYVHTGERQQGRVLKDEE